jgi:hypothetical protein
MSSDDDSDDLKPSSPGPLLRQRKIRELTNKEKALKLKNIAEERRRLFLERQLYDLQRMAEASREQMRTRTRRRQSFSRRKSFENYNANVPFSRRSNSRSNSNERIIYNEPLEVINVSPRTETDFERAMRIIKDRVRINPNAPRSQSNNIAYVPRSSFGTQFVVRDNDAIKKHTQAKRDRAARTITKMMKNKTKKRNK